MWIWITEFKNLRYSLTPDSVTSILACYLPPSHWVPWVSSSQIGGGWSPREAEQVIVHIYLGITSIGVHASLGPFPTSQLYSPASVFTFYSLLFHPSLPFSLPPSSPLPFSPRPLLPFGIILLWSTSPFQDLTPPVFTV